jgi:hypothetical protein
MHCDVNTRVALCMAVRRTGSNVTIMMYGIIIYKRGLRVKTPARAEFATFSWADNKHNSALLSESRRVKLVRVLSLCGFEALNPSNVRPVRSCKAGVACLQSLICPQPA